MSPKGIAPTWEITIMGKDSKTTPRGRDADTGKFVPVDYARDHPKDHIVERVPKPGYGDTGKPKGK
jgi:hypothetical protein